MSRGGGLRLEGLRHSYGHREALHDVSFSVEEGEIAFILGPNGAGKTTLLSILSGLIRRQAGSIIWQGQDIRARWTQWKRAVGVVLEDLYLFDSLTIGENLLFTGGLYGLGQAELKERIERLLVWFELDDRADTRVCEASFGMRKKLAVALALIHNPAFLLLDEALNGIDLRSGWNLRRLLRRCADSGKTVLMSTHNIGAACEIADRYIIIDSGRIVTDVKADTVGHSGKALEKLYTEALGVDVRTGGEIPWLT